MNYGPIIPSLNNGDGSNHDITAHSHFNAPTHYDQPAGYYNPTMDEQEESKFDLIRIFYYFLKHR